MSSLLPDGVSVADLEVAHSVAAERTIAVVRDETATDHARVREVCNYFLLCTMLGDSHKDMTTSLRVGKQRLGPEQDEDLFAYGLVQAGGNYEDVMDFTDHIYGSRFVSEWAWGLHHIEREDKVPGIVIRGQTKSMRPAQFILGFLAHEASVIEPAAA